MKKVRTARNINLDNIADELKIRKKYLEAIESGRLEDMPGRAYSDGYIKMYASYLGVSDEVLHLEMPVVRRNAKKFTNVRKHIDDNWILSAIFGVLILALFVMIWLRSEATLHSGKTTMEELLNDDKYDFVE